ncbi:uncharacterized protein N7473_011187 [Penicillium subrubescens]|nr:uncharacterized protein N7473_013114 [Penicillium subrubescens]XP_057004248.1 uncharacterized protein N7473_011187 [Penicillium subrubescens]KAJ5875001.1 hypothetical protein N7473_013114 [Penicillium subrubescens]KAJ5882753.1 hypothetical protein N7473_011187 [Penicillium subrubescens]
MNRIRNIVHTASRLSPIGRIAARSESSETRTQYFEQRESPSVLAIGGEHKPGLENVQGVRRPKSKGNQSDFISTCPTNQNPGQDMLRPSMVRVGGPLKSAKSKPGGYGQFGGRFVPEPLMGFLHELELAIEAACSDPSFWTEYQAYQRAQPTPLLPAYNLTGLASGTDEYGSVATIWLKRDDENEYGTHKTRNIVGQLLLARRLGRRKIVTDCASAKHGIFTAKMCKQLELECVITIGAADALAQVDGIHAMVMLGARVLTASPPSGNGTLRAAVNEAIRYLASNHDTAYYLPGGPIGPAPLPDLNRIFQALLGKEVMVQMDEAIGCRPDALVAAVGSGSGAVGLFGPFVTDPLVRLVGVEGADTAVLSAGSPGVLQGARTLVLQDHNGQILDSHSISADMNISTVGPEIAHWKTIGRMESVLATDAVARAGFRLLERYEGIRPGLDCSHAVETTMRIAKELGQGKHVVMLLTGDDSGKSIRSQLVREI